MGGWVGRRMYWSAKVIAKAKSFWACLRGKLGVWSSAMILGPFTAIKPLAMAPRPRTLTTSQQQQQKQQQLVGCGGGGGGVWA